MWATYYIVFCRDVFYTIKQYIFLKKNLYIVLFERSNKLIFQDDGIEKRNENLVNPANDIEKRNI